MIYQKEYLEMKISSKTIALTTVAAIASLTLSGCSSNVDTIDKLIDEAKYDEALTTFSEWKDMKPEEKEALIERMKENLAQSLEKYALEQITYDEATALIDTVSSLYISELDEDITQVSVEIKALSESKQSYKQGLSAYDSKDYLNAIVQFNNVLENDCNYENATAKAEEAIIAYTNSITAQVDALLKQGDYQGAAQALDQINENVTKANLKSSATINESISTLSKKTAVSQGEDYAEKKDYESALKVLNDYRNEYSEEDAEINKLHDEYADQYVDFIVKKVEALRKDKNYLKALEMLDNAVEIVNAPEFATLIDKINKEKPTYLCDVLYQNSDRYELLSEGEPVMDTIGNTYEPGNLFEISSSESGWSNYDGYADYYLGYKYNKLQGVIAVDNQSVEANCTLYIEGDGVVLETLEFNRLSVPTPIDIDISSVNVLKFRTGDFDGDEGDFYFILSDMVLTHE